MSETVFMKSSGDSSHGGGTLKNRDPLERLRSRLAIETGRPATGILSEEDLEYFDAADIETALEEINQTFRDAARKVRQSPKNSMALRRLSQVALNKRLLEKRLEWLVFEKSKAS